MKTKTGTYTRPVAKLFKLEDHGDDTDFVKEGSMLPGTSGNSSNSDSYRQMTEENQNETSTDGRK